MKLLTKDGDNLMNVERLEVSGNDLIVHGEIMGALPVRAVMTPDQARAALRLLNPSILFYLLTVLFRPGSARAQGASR